MISINCIGRSKKEKLEAAWRGRVDRMAALLAEMPESPMA
jgi:hypothetical protein